MSRDDAALEELTALYREVDALYAGMSCDGTTECCRFGVTGRQPYVTAIELALLRRAIGARGGMPKETKRALPLAKGRDERICPMLGRDARCTVYAARPLGCRTFYCERAVGEPPDRSAQREIVARLRDIAARHSLGGDEARPLTRAL